MRLFSVFSLNTHIASSQFSFSLEASRFAHTDVAGAHSELTLSEWLKDTPVNTTANFPSEAKRDIFSLFFKTVLTALLHIRFHPSFLFYSRTTKEQYIAVKFSQRKFCSEENFTYLYDISIISMQLQLKNFIVRYFGICRRK